MRGYFVVLLLILLCFIDANIYARRIEAELGKNIIRIHVIANDDSKEAQELKLLVRDAVLNKMRKEDFETYEKACEYVKKNEEEIRKCVCEVLKSEGAIYDVNIEFGNYDFPTKEYGNLNFPAGNYNAIKISLGEAQGKNWWCVVYPTLCFDENVCDTTNAQIKLEEQLSSECFSLINGGAKFKFKILEMFSNRLFP